MAIPSHCQTRRSASATEGLAASVGRRHRARVPQSHHRRRPSGRRASGGFSERRLTPRPPTSSSGQAVSASTASRIHSIEDRSATAPPPVGDAPIDKGYFKVPGAARVSKRWREARDAVIGTMTPFLLGDLITLQGVGTWGPHSSVRRAGGGEAALRPQRRRPDRRMCLGPGPGERVARVAVRLVWCCSMARRKRAGEGRRLVCGAHARPRSRSPPNGCGGYIQTQGQCDHYRRGGIL